MSDLKSPDEEPKDLQDLETPAYLRRDKVKVRNTQDIGGKNRDKEGGSTSKSNPFVRGVNKIDPNQITSRDYLGYSELDSYQDNTNLNNLKKVVSSNDDPKKSPDQSGDFE